MPQFEKCWTEIDDTNNAGAIDPRRPRSDKNLWQWQTVLEFVKKAGHEAADCQLTDFRLTQSYPMKRLAMRNSSWHVIRSLGEPLVVFCRTG